VRKHTRPRTRTRPSDWWVASVTARPARVPRTNGAVRPKDVPASADGRKRRCASPDDRSAHRTPMSFARSGTALSRSAAYRQARLRRVARLPALPPLSPPALRGMPDLRSRRNSASPLEGWRGNRSVSAGWSANRPHDPRQALRHRWCSSFNGAASRFRGLRPLEPGQVRAPDGVRGLQAVARLAEALAVVAVPDEGPPSPWGAPAPNGTWPLRSIRPAPAARRAFPQGISGSGATPGRQGRGCESTLVAKPHQALGAGGRSRHGPCGPSSNGRTGRGAAGRCATVRYALAAV